MISYFFAMKELSIVIPVYNSEKTIAPLVLKLIEQFQNHDIEIVLADDGSRDDSANVIWRLAQEHPNVVRALVLSKNFGEHGAVMACLNHAQGSYVVIMDDDFQNPPSEVSKLVEKIRAEKLDVVYGVYEKKQHSIYRNLGSKLNNLMASFLIKKPRGLYLSSFKCMSQFVCREITKYDGPYPYIDGLIFRVTSKVGTLTVQHSKREQGRSNYSFSKLVALWANMAFNFSILPLRLSMLLGFAFSIVGLVLIVQSIIEKLIFSSGPQVLGWASLFVAILTFSGVQLILIGLVGEYIGRIFLMKNKLPQFVVRKDSQGKAI